ncbi:tRNA1(Val) (adenine(37)-N6)-methyltransferase [Pseudalkalibacillus hwajinpoensis]|uniref:tRNA1(Val) (Adenine(37)-N6)-methyltransferase n=1 Tax=Guptibacillus hwajinpoensis TaxID=208199 RepID=A0A4U1M926_9BACL|nr:tRNA1(Val) (adenine(37)-N6)-methyltransferase [Pseudalkalibacillus hwajinpoensis]TKD66911.1 tRNA1(Val) (adenine(37)-N6)-methyltransferase [Pseudalkalibacillus hwajinpoensis]
MQLNDDERIDYVIEDELQIIQSPTVFSFSLDALLLAKFSWVPIKRGKIIDLCTGNGIIPLLLSRQSEISIEGVEIQERLYDMGTRSVALNKLDDQITLHHADLRDLPVELKRESYDAVTCNPPYFKSKRNEQRNLNEHLTIARHEVMCTLEDVIRSCSSLAKQGGKVSLVHRPERLLDIMTLMRKYRIEPKRMQLVYPKAGKEANTLLIEGIKDGKPDLKVLPPFTVYNGDNTYTEEMRAVYEEL